MKEVHTWKKMQEGNIKALEDIYRKYVDTLFDFGKKFTRDDVIVEDSIQNLFIDIWNKREHLSLPKNVKAYLLLSLKRRVIRESKRNLDISMGEQKMDFFLEASTDRESQIIENEIYLEKSTKLSHALKDLSSRQKEILYLKFSVGLSNQEIANQLEMNNQSVRNAVHRSIDKLKKMILSLLF